MPKGLSPKGKVKALKNTFNNQLSFEDRVQTLIMANAYRKAYIEQSSLNASGDDKNVEAFPEELGDAIDEMNEQLFKEMFGDGSMKSIMEGYKKFGYVFSSIITQQGADYEKILSNIPETESQRENKAAFLAYKKDGAGKYMTGAYQEMFGISGFSSYLLNTPEVEDKIWDNFNFTKYSTVENYYKGLGKSDKEIEQLCKENKCEKGSNLIEFFTRTEKEKILNLRKANQAAQAKEQNKPIEEITIDLTEPKLTEEDVISSIKRDYVHEFLDICDSNSLNISYAEAFNAVNQLPQKNRDLFTKGNYVYSGTKKSENNPSVEIHILKGNSEKLAKNEEEKKQITNEINEFQQWSKDVGEKEALRMSKDGANDIIKDFEAKIFSGKNMGFRDDAAIADLYKNEIKEYDPSFLKGAIHDLENSAKGTNHKDSKEFQKMIKSLKQFTFLVSAGSGGSALEARDNLIKDCMEYIKDKMGRVRSKDYGKKRFDDTMLVLAEIMPEKDFRALVDTVNHKRSAKPGSDKYIDYDKTYRDKYVLGTERSRIRLEERAREDKVQKETLKNKTKLMYADISRIEILDKLFGRKPRAPEFMIYALGGGASAKQAFPEIKEKFSPIGPYREDFNLSEKDFAAIAYAATLTPEAAAQDTRNPDMSPQQKLNKFGAGYTADFMFDTRTQNCGEWCAGPVQFGREYAASAMRAYEAGQKGPLARILQEGIKAMNNEAKKARVLSDTFIANNEMMNRMKGMMERDPELTRLVLKDRGLTAEDFKDTRDTALGAQIVTDYKIAFHKLKHNEGLDTKEKRVDVVTDILLKTVYDKYMIQCSDEKNKRIVALEDFRNPKARATLRNSVKEYVKKNQLEEMSYGFIRDKLHTSKMAADTNNIARNFMKSLHKTASAEKQMAK